MDYDLQDKLSTPSSWIPIKTLRKIMGLTESRPIPPNTSPDNEDLPNKSINSSPSFTALHHKYTVPFPKVPFHPSTQAFPSADYIKHLEQKLKISESEVQHLKVKLKSTELENCELIRLINRLKTEHMIRLQTIQEQHEKKLQKTKKDLDCLLKEMNSRSNLIILEDFIQIHLNEMEKCRLNYEEIFKGFLKQANRREKDKEFMDSISQKLEGKLENELDSLKERYEYQIEKLKEFVTNESLEDFDSELSTRINSERATSELKGSLLESTQKLHFKSPKSSFYHN